MHHTVVLEGRKFLNISDIFCLVDRFEVCCGSKPICEIHKSDSHIKYTKLNYSRSISCLFLCDLLKNIWKFLIWQRFKFEISQSLIQKLGSLKQNQVAPHKFCRIPFIVAILIWEGFIYLQVSVLLHNNHALNINFFKNLNVFKTYYYAKTLLIIIY